ncbi:MAG: ATP-binding protein [Gammaproteobacteria bacterium]
MLIGDATRLRQVVVNLLSNAITYTLQGQVELHVQCVSISAAELNLRIEVKDTGIGIAADLHEHIFNAFARADDSRRRQFGGTGLGLSICRELVEMMGGQIGVQSQPGQGSTFWFTCPVTAGAKTTAPDTIAVNTDKTAATASAAVKSLLGAQVLLVEDNMINQLVARTMLHQLGCQVCTANDGLAAVSAATTQHFDLIIMDCQMPELDGYGATIEIRRWEQAHDKRPYPDYCADGQCAAGGYRTLQGGGDG